jgi:glycosyltransferase involved in cell wall biosynthesis
MNRLHVPGRVWIDVSPLRKCPTQPTGIPRVILSLTRELLAMDYANVRLCVVEEQRALRSVTAAEVFDRFQSSSPADVGIPVAEKTWPTRIASSLRRRWRQSAPLGLLWPDRIDDLGPDDLLVSLGGGWTSDPGAVFYRRLKNDTGVRIVNLLFDLIPTVRPGFFASIVQTAFVPWLREVPRITDLVLAISQRTRDDFAAYCSAERLPDGPAELIRLGDDFEVESPLGRASRPVLRGDLRPQSFVLSVGTLEPRKNHELLYQVWRYLLWKHGPERVPLLALAGRPGWLTDELRHRIATDPRVSNHIRMMPDADDAQLAELYAASLFTVYPSLYEGWGLPVAESLARGKVCIASATSSIPEIAPELTELCDPQDALAWMAAIERFVFGEETRKRREREIRLRYQPTRWRDTAAQIVTHLENHFGEPVISRGVTAKAG